MSFLSRIQPADRPKFLWFGALTLWLPAGLLMAGVSLSNGPNREWPPDDLTESIGFWSAVAVFLGLFAATLIAAGKRAGQPPVRTESVEKAGNTYTAETATIER